MEDVLPPRRWYNDSKYWIGDSINNQCPPGASIYDRATLQSYRIKGPPEFSCWTTGPDAPEICFQSKCAHLQCCRQQCLPECLRCFMLHCRRVNGALMYKIFDRFSAYGELFGKDDSSLFPWFGVMTDDSRGSNNMYIFWNLVRCCLFTLCVPRVRHYDGVP